jgi:diadenosine tetraphosphate (Ap4A) HIT family hydrolase
MANPTEAKFGDPATRVAQTPLWSVLLRPRQPTLGSLVLVCREPAEAFDQLSTEAFAELRQVVRMTEAALREVTAYERINYLMLMMVDRDVHFHVIPRYSGSRNFGGTEYRDAGWPGAPLLDSAVSVDGPARDALVAELRRAWQRAGA